MDDLLRQFLFYEDLPPGERRAAREALDDALADEAPARALRQWQAARRRVGERFQSDLPARRLLVLYALHEDPASTDALSAPERRDLDAARPQVEAALRAHPALGDVIEHIRRERDTFEAVWAEHAATPSTAEPSAAEARPAGESSTRHADGRRAADRPATTSRHRTSRHRTSRHGPKRRSVRRWGWRAAAVLALVAFCAVVFSLLQRNRHTVTVTAEGEKARLVELADGSTVRLMPGATLAYVDPEAGAALDRQATLQSGRAFFDITPAQQGFIVETPTARMTVLGTRFGVTARPRLTRVVLASGHVSLASKAAAGQPVRLRPGQASRVAKGALPSTPAPVDDLTEALAWTGLFVFRDTPARRIAQQLAAHYDRTVTVAPALRDEEVTGTFDRRRPLRETLGTLAAALGARVEERPGGYALVASGA